MRKLPFCCLSLLSLYACSSQRALAPRADHLAQLPASFARPPTPEEMELRKSLEARSGRAQAAHGQAEKCRSKDSAPHRFDFGQADENHDRKISRAEFNCEALGWFGAADPDKNHRLHVAKHAHKAHRAELAAHDRAGRGELTVIQFLSAMDRRFARADKNHDGYLDQKEFAAGSLATLPSAKGAR